MKKIATMLLVFSLITGCSSGGGTTSSGDGLGIQTTTSNLLLSALLVVTTGGAVSGASVDAFIDLCNAFAIANAEAGQAVAPVFESGLTTAFGQFTVTSRDLVDASGLTPVEFFPEGVTFNRYLVSYTSPNAFAPRLQDRVFQQTFTLLNGTATGSFSVVLLDLDVILAEFQQQSSQSIASYNVKVTAMGAELNGTPISVSAETFIEVGNFDRC